MTDNNTNLNINSNSFSEKDNAIQVNNNTEINNSSIENLCIKNSSKEQSKSPKKVKKKKKRKKNRHISIVCKNKIINKSNSDIKNKTNNKSEKNETPKKHKIEETNGKILSKLYMIQLFKKKKMYSEKIKLMKIFKRHSSAKVSNIPSTLNIKKQYSQKVYNSNREIISIQRKRDIEKEKEKVKELLELLGINHDQLLKSENLNNNGKNLLPSLTRSGSLSPKRLFSNSNKSPINLKYNKFNDLFSNNSKIIKNQRYYLNQNTELRRCESSGIENYLSKNSYDINKNIKSYKFNNQSLIKIQINNSHSRNNLFKHEQYRAKSPYESRQEEIDRFSKIRKSYQKQTVVESLKEFNRLYYLILPGNASYLIKNCMCHRTNWREAFTYATNLYNFKWQQISSGIDYVGLGRFGAVKQLVNHYENHFAISNKANMFINLMHYCEQRKISVFKYVPFTIVFEFKEKNSNDDEDKEQKYLEKLEKLKIFIDEAQKYVVNYNEIGKYYNEEKFIEEKKNRIEFFKEKVNKRKRYHEHIQEPEKGYNEDIKTFNGNFLVYRDYFKKIKLIDRIPIIVKDNIDYLCDKLKEKKKKLEKTIGTNTVIEIPDTHYKGKNMWVIKAINLNRGMCIQIVDNFNQMKAVLNKFKNGVNYDFTEKVIDENQIENIPIKENGKNIENKNDNMHNNKENKETKTIENNKINNNNKKDIKDIKEEEKNNSSENATSPMYYCNKIIIQKYIERPLLYKGRKCDMRIWVLITHQMKVYYFKEGHLKTCSITYDINSKDAFRHITNYSFQKYNDNFQKFEKGNEVPFYEFQKFIDENYPEKNYKLNKDLIKQIKEIVSLTTKSVKEQINKNERNYQFEIFGYDFMLDENFNLFLIEINTNPGLEESSPWIKIIVPRMLDDALRLTLDQLFNPGYDFNKIYKGEEENKNIEMVLNNLKNKIDPNAIDCITDLNNSNDKEDNNNDDLEKLEKGENSSQIEISNTSNSNEKEQEKQKEEIRANFKKNNGYISPFPVPGYNEDENLWEFVCDLNSKDPLDKNLDKEESKESKDNSGIKYLMNKKKENKNGKTEEEKKDIK